MKNNITELVFILDRIGSMAGLEGDTIGGFNALIEKQKKQAGTCFVTTILFDNGSTILHDRVRLSGRRLQRARLHDPSHCAYLQVRPAGGRAGAHYVCHHH